MKRRWLRAFLWALNLALMAMIFAFSSQGAAASMATSAPYAQPVLALLERLFPGDAEELFLVAQLIVRKCGHLLEYMALGCALRWLLMSYDAVHSLRRAWLIGALYAAGDELHQLLGGERTGMWQDVVLDSVGVLLGALLAAAAVKIYWKIRQRQGTR